MGISKRTHEQFVSEVRALVGDEYTVLGQYVNTDTKIRMRHNSPKCDHHEYEVRPFKFLAHGQRCGHPQCRGERTKTAWLASGALAKFLTPSKTDEEFRQEVQRLVGTEYVFLQPYATGKDRMRVRHDVAGCGHEYMVRADSFLLDGRRCPRCARLSLWHGGSRAVKRIRAWLESRAYRYEQEVPYAGLVSQFDRPLYFDFRVAVGETELLIEFDGVQHEKGWMGNPATIPAAIDNDRRKNDFCQARGLPLVRISHRGERQIEAILEEIFNHIEGSTTIPQGSTPQAIGGGNGRDPKWVLI